MTDHRKFVRRVTDADHPDPVLDMVAKATGRALDRRRGTMFRDSLMVGIIAALLIALPITLISRHDALQNAAYNCRLLTSIAQIDGKFVSTDAALRREQEINATRIAALRPGPLKRLLTDPETTRLANASRALDASTQRYWTTVLIPRLTALANANCPAATTRRGG